MINYKITIRNYRSIPADRPLELNLAEGINFVLGINNVGKTNLLKFFYELRYVWPTLGQNSIGLMAGLNISFDQLAHRESIDEPILCDIETDNLKASLKLSRLPTPNQCSVEAKSEGMGLIDQIFKPMSELFQNTLFVPPLRTLSRQSPGQFFDLIIGGHFIHQWDDWANGEDVRQRKMITALKNELRELFNLKTFDIQVSKSKETLLITTDDGMFKLEELGDGISHLIVVLGNVLLKQPSLILIDEPENGLHPKMQEVFVRALAAKSRFGLLATSHSIGLARSTADHIFSLTRDPVMGSKLSPYGQHHSLTISQSLTELGYSQFVEIGGNHLLLVEGRTDIKAFREILRKYGIEHHFIILSLGGAEFIGQQDKQRFIGELDELRRLNPKSISVIFDSERTSAGVLFDSRFQVFYDTCKELGFQVFPTDVRSTENYLNQAVIDVVIGKTFKALQPYEKFGSTGQKWDKNKNWLMFREMKKDDFKGTELNKFITTTLMPLCK